MTRATTLIIAAFLSSTAAATSLPVTFESPCECSDNHGQHRWAVTIDPSTPPADASAIQTVTPSNVFSWRGPGRTFDSALIGMQRAKAATQTPPMTEVLFFIVSLSY